MSDLLNAATPPGTPVASLPDEALERGVMRKVTLRLIPFLFLLYVVNILDRSNIGFAKLKMLDALDMSEQAYGLGAGIFYIGYCIFEIPSNLIMARTGARLWMGRIMISWGLISSAMMFVTGPWSFSVLRFLLGFAEAGFFPGIILYLTYWFPARLRAQAVARFMAASALVGILGNPLSGALLQYMDGAGGLPGWQWLFLLEGVPAVLLGVAVVYCLTDRPEQASWLSPAERNWLVRRLSREEQHRDERHGLTLFKAFAFPQVWLLTALYSTVALGTNCFGYYLPSIIRGAIGDVGAFRIGLVAALPYFLAMISMILAGAHSDRTGERRWHVSLAAFVAACGLGLTAVAPAPWVVVLGMALAAGGMWSMLAPFWSLPTAFLSGTAAAGGIALINSFGNLGGFVGPLIISQNWATGDNYLGGRLAMALTMFIGGVLALCVRHDATLETAPVADGPAPQVKEMLQ
jgi:ACS family tartrate transporter-like MFS transporter